MNLMKHSESGNALFYILLAVALLGSLSYAVSQNMRGGVQGLTEERQKLLATDILEFSDVVAKAVSQLRLRGSQFSEFSFAHPDLAAGYGVYGGADAEHEIFNPAGGAIVYKDANSESMTTPGPYLFAANNEVEQIGTTSGAAASSDLLLILQPLVRDVCIQINDILGITAAGVAPPQDTEIDTGTVFAGTASYDQTISDESAALTTRNAACFEDTTNNRFVFYQVLMAR